MVVGVLILVVGISTPSAMAQRSSGAAGLGGQLGDPSGVTVKRYNAGAPSYDLLGAWSSVEDFFFLNGHAPVRGVHFPPRMSISHSNGSLAPGASSGR
ncbi:MAG: hypothetical protein BRD35_06510 [Bacteroidetes bacterium QH_7_62_13]|nr:MAG: hypothetical protein BRD35_06510 [Bacteroidetes bacterium QH_7_62_13]